MTYYLKSKQIDKATEAKSFLEQRQREEAKERAEKSLKWQTKVRIRSIEEKRNVFLFLVFRRKRRTKMDL